MTSLKIKTSLTIIITDLKVISIHYYKSGCVKRRMHPFFIPFYFQILAVEKTLTAQVQRVALG